MAFLFKRAARFLATATVALSAVLSGQSAVAANNDPIVLVHGFLGFGPNELKGTNFKYWGGFNDIEARMRSYNGSHQVFTASVGPVSSNWDRAVELYYQIKGGCADYGAKRTAQFAAYGKIQKPAGKCWATDPNNNPNRYPLALYPQWDAAHPIHFVAHSQGGQTVRTLIQLLENGSPNGDEGGGALFTGGKVGWIKSATTIATPHNGTTLRNVIFNWVPNVSEMIGKFVEVAGLGGSSALYGFDLEQYGLAQGPSESAADFLERTKGAPFWSSNNRDAAHWDLSPDGARELNAWVKTSPNVFYYSMGSMATEKGSFCCNGTDRIIAPFQSGSYHYARNDMIFFTKPTAGEWVVPSLFVRGMGSYTQTDPSRVLIDSSWFPNDGVVNTVSMKAPAGQPSRAFDGNSLRGTWNYMGYYDNYDHFDVVGWLVSTSAVYPIFDRLAGILYGL
ncbi:esterase EstA [Noviherbaspirillum agri]